jgi:hypothetical protein
MSFTLAGDASRKSAQLVGDTCHGSATDRSSATNGEAEKDHSAETWWAFDLMVRSQPDVGYFPLDSQFTVSKITASATDSAPWISTWPNVLRL